MCNISVNRVRISGNICANANISATKNFAGFDLAHNCGRGRETLYDKVKMFSKNGNKDINIPFDLLTKGKRVLVEGFRVCEEESFTTKSGKDVTKKRVYIIALTVKDYPWHEDKSNPSVNEVEISGRLYDDARKSTSGNFAGFDMAHNAGKDRLCLSDSIKMFAGTGEGAVVIPHELLNKGTRVLVKGSRRAEKDTFISKEGVEVTVIKTIVVASSVNAYPWEGQAEDGPAPEEGAEPMAS